MLLNAGRLLMIGIWAFLVLNLITPFPKPLKYFLDIALLFMVIMHGLQLILLQATQPKNQPTLSRMTQIKIFFFGVFELLRLPKNH